MNDEKKKAQKQYSEAFKKMVIRELLQGELDRHELAKKYNLPHYNTITVWYHYFRRRPGELDVIPLPTLSKEQRKDAEPLKQRNKELENALSMANLKIAGLETMINIAEEQLKISIRKKSGTKQSRR